MNSEEKKKKRKWIQEQFDKGRPKRQYRDVLLHASLIESIVRHKVKVFIERKCKIHGLINSYLPEMSKVGMYDSVCCICCRKYLSRIRRLTIS